MSFISYAQNFEDVMLYRALKQVESGFYIDVGAMDPVQDSVTKAFYDRGWRGINIEPVSQWFQKLERARPGDINLQVAAASAPGEMVLYEFSDSGLSTTKKALAEQHVKDLGCQPTERRVPARTLTDICRDYRTSSIHFLKVDVEGAEEEVLHGTDFSVIRPWIILIEATMPRTGLDRSTEWQSMLLEAGYEDVYFDGLNRFYLSRDHLDTSNAFSCPPNCFDEFVLSETHRLCAQVYAELNRKTQELAAVYSSKSWRLTNPLRKLLDLVGSNGE